MLLLLYYFICTIYCIVRLYKKWDEQHDMGGNAMELLMVLCIGWILGPIDFAIVGYKRFHTEKKEVKLDFKIDKDDHIY